MNDWNQSRPDCYAASPGLWTGLDHSLLAVAKALLLPSQLQKINQTCEEDILVRVFSEVKKNNGGNFFVVNGLGKRWESVIRRGRREGAWVNSTDE